MHRIFPRTALLLAALGAFSLPAGMALQSASASTVQSKDITGYSTTRWVRTDSATFKLPTNTACAQSFATRSPAGDGMAITLGPAEESNAGVAYSSTTAASTVGLSFVPSVSGCGLISPSFASNVPGYTSAAQFPATTSFLPGDSVTISLYYNTSAYFTTAIVKDNTNGASLNSSFTASAPVTYMGGSAVAGYGPYTPQGGSAKLWAVKSVTLKTYTGHLGAIGTFSPNAVSMTSDGTSAGTLYSNPGGLWNAGENFSVFSH
jgi:hypothetical protein